jgi:hypothetical protein
MQFFFCVEEIWVRIFHSFVQEFRNNLNHYARYLMLLSCILHYQVMAENSFHVGETVSVHDEVSIQA